MKTVILQRCFSNELATLGALQIEYQKHDPIFTLENPKRETDHDSLIDAGTYICKKFSGAKYQNVFEVTNVPRRTSILLHWGNFEKDTQGCILLGLQAGSMNDAPCIMQSRNAFELFRKLINDDVFQLIIIDRP